MPAFRLRVTEAELDLALALLEKADRDAGHARRLQGAGYANAAAVERTDTE